VAFLHGAHEVGHREEDAGALTLELSQQGGPAASLLAAQAHDWNRGDGVEQFPVGCLLRGTESRIRFHVVSWALASARDEDNQCSRSARASRGMVLCEPAEPARSRSARSADCNQAFWLRPRPRWVSTWSQYAKQLDAPNRFKSNGSGMPSQLVLDSPMCMNAAPPIRIALHPAARAQLGPVLAAVPFVIGPSVFAWQAVRANAARQHERDEAVEAEVAARDAARRALRVLGLEREMLASSDPESCHGASIDGGDRRAP